MNRTRLIVAGVVVAVLIVLYAIGSSSVREEAGPFQQYTTCSALIAAFEVMPVPNSATARRQLGDEYRARFRELDCSL